MKATTIVALLMISFNLSAFQEGSHFEGLEIRFQPDSVVYVYENIGPEMPKQLYTAVIQNMAYVNTSPETLIIDQVNILVKKNGDVIQKQIIDHSKLTSNAQKYHMYQQHGILEQYDFQFQTSRYLENINISSNDTLQPNEAIIITHETFLFENLPDEVEIVVEGKITSGETVFNTNVLKVVDYKSKNEYAFPLKGAWLTAAGPSLIGHHRWGMIQEFAFDFIKIGNDLSSFQNTGSELEDYYAFGETVYTIDDGEVVAVLDGIEESSNNLKRPNEKEEDYLKRMRPYQEQLMAKGLQYVFGNHVIIKHDNNEYSAYFHLKNNSVQVSVGDILKQGDIIGALGHSGNSTEPHLHFHVSDGPDIAYARSIPVEFNNIVLFPADNGSIRHLHSGQIISTKQ